MFSLKPHLVIPNKRGIYLRRWFCTKWSDDNHQWKGRRLPNMYLHNMLDHDDDRALHDHPWDNLSIVLWGGYIEHVFAYSPVEGQPLPPIIQKKRRMGSIVYRQAHLAHRLELYKGEWVYNFPLELKKPTWKKLHEGVGGSMFEGEHRRKPCWTLFLTWRKTRDWGFWCEKNGIVGTVNYQVGDETVILATPGKIATWVHQKLFHDQGGC